MASKPYPQIEETSSVAKEPAVAYQSGMNERISSYVPTPYEMEVLRRSEEDYKAGRVYTQEEVDEMVAEWLRPHTLEEIHAICDEAEADDEADRLLEGKQVFAMMESKYPWLCK